MKKNIFILIISICMLHSGVSIYLGYSMAVNSEYDVYIDGSSLGGPHISFSNEIEFDNSMIFAFDVPIYEFDEVIIKGGISYMVQPLEKENLEAILLYSGKKYQKKTDLSIGRVYVKTIFPIENNLSFWIVGGLNDIKSKYLQFEILANFIPGNPVISLPFYQLDFKNDFSYGVGFDYKLENGLLCGFSFINDKSSFDAKLKLDELYYLNVNSVEFEMLTKSIHLGYAF